MSTPAPDSRVPEKPTIDGIETRWAQKWHDDGTYGFDRTKSRAEVYAIDVSFPALKDKAEFDYLNRQPTSFVLPAEAVDRLRALHSPGPPG